MPTRDELYRQTAPRAPLAPIPGPGGRCGGRQDRHQTTIEPPFRPGSGRVFANITQAGE